jgi:hypothetical protein
LEGGLGSSGPGPGPVAGSCEHVMNLLVPWEVGNLLSTSRSSCCCWQQINSARCGPRAVTQLPNIARQFARDAPCTWFSSVWCDVLLNLYVDVTVESCVINGIPLFKPHELTFSWR